jgi:nucleotide-binding universal stress UspA family protein
LITKILVGVDGSENSLKALDYALELAEKFSASVHILNVFQAPMEFVNSPNMVQPAVSGYPQDLTAYPQNIVAFMKDLRKMHEETLSKATDRATRLKASVKVTSELKDGEPPSIIVDTASRGEFDLIVIGHKGESRFNELFLGSTSERVAHQAKCTVLIAK